MNYCCRLLVSLGILQGGDSVIAAQEREATPAVVNPPIASPLRATIRLHGAWDFAVDPNKVGDEQRWFSPDAPLPGKTTIQAPGCWEAQGVGGPGDSKSATPERSLRPLSGSYVGAAWYRRELTAPEAWAGKQIWLKIGGVNAQGWFWVNGAYVGHNESYCGAYKYNVTDLVKPGQRIVVVAKVRNDVPSGKGLMNWIHRFGGLYRDVEIEATPAASIDDAYVVGDVDKRTAAVHVILRNVGLAPKAGDWYVNVAVCTLDGVEAGRAGREVALADNGVKEIVLQTPLDPFRPWSPDQPNLYKASITLTVDGKPVDGWIERFGVRKWEVRGGDFYLNNHRFFVRGFGDDSIYPLTLSSPASREFHRKHLETAKQYGFVYVRHHTHCETPEFFDVADELGLMIQPELPYYGAIPSAGDPKFFRPKQDLRELYAHYRRYVSFSTYCTGNEGYMGSPLDRELYRLGKQLDPTRLMQHQDGGNNQPGNSDFDTGPHIPWTPGQALSFWGWTQVGKPAKVVATRPFFAHEYLNLATDEDPRLEAKYTGAVRPPATAAAFKRELQRNGLSWDWGIACLDAAYALKKHCQKRGLEQARLDPACGGYIYWTIVDVGSPSAQGLLDQFWQPKKTMPAEFRQFNGPAAILAKITPDAPVLAAGETRKVEWWISNFDAKPIDGKTLKWTLANDETPMAGTIDGVQAGAGEVKKVGETILTAPAVQKPQRAKLTIALEGGDLSNAWDLWLFPTRRPRPDSGNDLSAAKSVFKIVSSRYPGAVLAGTPEAAAKHILLTDALDRDAFEALEQGATVLLVKLAGPKPGVELGWWGMANQRGAAVARHPAFGLFPHDGCLSPLFFRLVDGTVLLSDELYRGVEPLMVGHGVDGYLAYVFQTRASRGKLFAAGLNVLADCPEGRFLLDQFLDYVRSDQFQPKASAAFDRWRAQLEKSAKPPTSANGK